jgi:hypothetical protein
MLTAELRLLSAHAPAEARRASRSLRRRFAGLNESLGIAHLDAGDARQARTSFWAAFRERPSFRRLGLVAASFFPAALLEIVRAPAIKS